MALQADPKWTPALIGSARALEDDNPPQAVSLATHALEINPSSVDAQVFLAQEAADADHLDQARQALDKALEVEPSGLDARAARRARVVDDKPKDFEFGAAALAIAPNYGDVYHRGRAGARGYRFDRPSR